MEKNGKILVVDDNEDVLFALHLLLESYVEKVKVTTRPDKILPFMDAFQPDVILLDMNFQRDMSGGQEGFDCLKEILKRDPEAVVVFMTAYSDTEKAVRAIKAGATDFIPKPWDNEKLIATVSAALKLSQDKQKAQTSGQPETQAEKPAPQQSLDKPETVVLGESPAFLALLRMLRQCSDTDANLLLLGENGTGKDLLARYTCGLSSRRDKAYVSIDLGSIPDTLFESELFGYERGAFTDARRGKPGRLESAQGGTLFLNEIGNLSLPLQAKLLSVIEQRRASRLGSTSSYPVDVRLICATNTDLYAAVERREFRQDLLYRINTIEVRIPPLRERGDDLFLLADAFLARYREKYHKEVKGFTREARRQMQLYPWPGNVRELEHAVERAVILSSGPQLTAQDFSFLTRHQPEAMHVKERYNLERIERDNIEEVLRLCQGNITLAAEMLGITRTSLYRRIEKFGL